MIDDPRVPILAQPELAEVIGEQSYQVVVRRAHEILDAADLVDPLRAFIANPQSNPRLAHRLVRELPYSTIPTELDLDTFLAALAQAFEVPRD